MAGTVQVTEAIFSVTIGKEPRMSETQALDYGLLVTRIKQAVEEAISHTRRRERLVVRMPNRELYIPYEEIDWIEPQRNNLRIHSGPRSYTIRDTLAAVERRLPETEFVRIQRSIIVNVARIEEVRRVRRGYEVVLKNGARLPLGRSYRGRLEQVLDPT